MRCTRLSASLLVTISSTQPDKHQCELLNSSVSSTRYAQKPVLTMNASMAAPVTKQMGMSFLRIGASGTVACTFRIVVIFSPWFEETMNTTE
jgi:hypothetical protein